MKAGLHKDYTEIISRSLKIVFKIMFLGIIVFVITTIMLTLDFYNTIDVPFINIIEVIWCASLILVMCNIALIVILCCVMVILPF